MSLITIIGACAVADVSLPEFHAEMDRAGFCRVTDECAVNWMRRYTRWLDSWMRAEASGLDIEDFGL
jgi:hypothetical protein